MAENKQLFIADASVLIKWAVNEKEDLEQALLFKKDFVDLIIDIQVPSHCFPEIANILGRFSHEIATSFLSYLLTSHILECRLNLDLAHKSLRFMKKYKDTSFYDASYHALAIQEKAQFITADEKYYKKTRKEGHIMLLKDYGKKR